MTNDSKSVDISRDAQLRDIENSFKAVGEDFDLSKLKHPNKPGVTAVGSYEILPDTEIWANAYDLFRFSERPGDRAADVSRLAMKNIDSFILTMYRYPIHGWNVVF